VASLHVARVALAHELNLRLHEKELLDDGRCLKEGPRRCCVNLRLRLRLRLSPSLRGGGRGWSVSRGSCGRG
jgi:hypothetical protein